MEAVAQVILPPGIVLLSAADSSGLETRLSAKFRLPRAQLDGFVTSARFTAAPPLRPGSLPVRLETVNLTVGSHGRIWTHYTAAER